jgi:hypothetical protein
VANTASTVDWDAHFTAGVRAEIRALYWETDIPALEIAYTYRLKPHQLTAVAGPITLPSHCGWCEAPETARSRSARADREKWWVERLSNEWRRQHPVGWIPGDRCDRCNEAFRRWQELDEETGNERSRGKYSTSEVWALRSLPYDEYLQTPHWKEGRTKALNRARWRCQLCNRRENLNVHHRTYERRGHESPGDLIVLCRDCHKLFHKNRRVA